MPEWLILIFVLYIIYIIMKKSKTTTEKPAIEATGEQPAVTKASKTTPKKPSPAQPASKKAPIETAESATPEANTDQVTATKTSKAAPKKPSPAQPAAKKAQAAAAPTPVAVEPVMPENKANAEQATAAETSKAAPKKPSPAQPAAKKVPTEAAKPAEAAPELAMPERVGLTAGSIWHYLAENGATPVAKLVKELTEEEKVVQRSIGWLAQEGKITLATVDRVETLALKD